MSKGVVDNPWKRRAGRAAVLLAIVAAGLVPLATFAQTTPNATAEQLQQLLGAGSGSQLNRPAPVIPQTTIIEPLGQLAQPLAPSRLEQIMSQRAGAALQQFGYDQFGVGRAVALPQAGAPQDSYILGPGDEIVITLRGQENIEYRAPVNRDGQVVLPRLAPILASGRSLGDLRDDISAAVRRAYVATSAFVTLGQMRQISVYVTGEVNNPGVRVMTGLSSPVDAILVSGGVKKTGSLRNVRILRAGREIPVDLYGLLTQRSSVNEITLAEGDRIVVPPLGRTVAAVGWVRRPAIYELSPGQSAISVSSLISLAGGFEVRGKYRLSVLRLLANGQSAMVTASQGSAVRDSEILFAIPGAQQTTSQAILSGGSALAGQYSLGRTSRLSDLLKAPGALGESPYSLFGIVVHRDPATLLRTPIAFTPLSVMNGREDMDLSNGDTVRVFSVNEAHLLFAVVKAFRDRRRAADEALRAPRAAEQAQAAAQQYAAAVQQTSAGGSFPTQVAPSFSQNGITTTTPNQPQVLLPQRTGPNDERQDIGELSMMTLSDTGLVPPTQQMLVLNPQGSQTYSVVPVQQMPGTQPYGQQYPDQTLQPGYGGYDQLSGQQQYPLPQYPQVATNGQNGLPYQPYQTVQPYGPNPGAPTLPQNLQTQPVSPGEVPTNREVRTFGELSHQLGLDALVLVRFMMDHEVTLNGAVRGPGNYLVGPSVDLGQLVMAAGGTSQWADQSGVLLTSTQIDPTVGASTTRETTLPVRAETLATYIVRPHDDFRFNEVFTNAGIGSVTIQGELRHTGIYQLVRGEHLSDLLQQAGGLTDVAYPYGAVFLRKSAAEIERDGYRRAAQDIQSELLLAMTRSDPNRRMSPEAFSAMQNFIAQLRTQTPLGRVTAVVDPAVLAVKPQLDMLLEPGDVLYVPQRPSTVSVLGEVMQPGSYTFQPKANPDDYVSRAGGFSQFADDDLTFVVLPDGTASKVERSWLSFDGNKIPPGSAIVVPRDVDPLDISQLTTQITQILSQLAVTAASLAVIAQNN